MVRSPAIAFIVLVLIIIALISNQLTLTIPPTSMFWYIDKIKDRVDVSLTNAEEKTEKIMDIANERVSELEELDKNKNREEYFDEMKDVLDDYKWLVEKISNNWDKIKENDKTLVKDTLEEYHSIISNITKNKDEDILGIVEKITEVTSLAIKKLEGVKYPDEKILSEYVNRINKKINLEKTKNEKFLLQIQDKDKIKRIYEINIINGEIETITQVATTLNYVVTIDEKELIGLDDPIESAILSVLNSTS